MILNKDEINCDFLIIGGGIIGLTLALELRKRYPSESITIIDKESKLAAHSSGRNSGVIHAGFYYSPDSFKAKFTRNGNLAMRQYCYDKKIPVSNCGKLIVAKTEEELTKLDILMQRAKIAEVPLEKITIKEARDIQPLLKSIAYCLWSPSTSCVDPTHIMSQLEDDAAKARIEIIKGCKFNKFKHCAGFIINAAGLYADKIAAMFGFSENYEILPFKGLYLYLDQSLPVKTNIYPVPNLKNPFLGVHFTLTNNSKIKIGPTAIPCFWREQYSGTERFSLKESCEIIKTSSRLLSQDFVGHSRLFIEELKKYNKSKMISEAQQYIDFPIDESKAHWGEPGIRAQLVDKRTKKLVMDFCVESDNKSLHILNAVSPAFTCSFSFAEYVCDKYL